MISCKRWTVSARIQPSTSFSVCLPPTNLAPLTAMEQSRALSALQETAPALALDLCLGDPEDLSLAEGAYKRENLLCGASTAGWRQ